ncbi:MAG: TadA family conjugal transfer-associated ATPase [Actinobacteria bacterium]|nr:TadA family conjugal transfer-associated ATPase [Actinomycetota bacterium]
MSRSKSALVERVRGRLIASGAEPSPAKVAEALREEGLLVGDESLIALVAQLRSELAGAGPLEALMADEFVSDVLVNGPDSVWVDRGRGLEATSVSFGDETAVRRLAQRLAARAGRRLDDASPYVDARLPDGARLHAVIPPVAPRGTCISIRVPRKRGFSLPELVAAGMMPDEGARWLEQIVARRLAFLVSGGTGAGKTTLLATLLSLVPDRDRLLVVEDSSELDPNHPHVVRLESRPPNVEGVGAVTLRDLVRQALRMRPDRLVLGEVRGAEVVELLSALNTGHEGGCGTLHANSATDVPARLEALALAAGLPRAALHAQVAAGLDAVIHVDRSANGIRLVREVCVLVPQDDHLVRSVTALRFGEATVVHGPGLGRLKARLAGSDS